MRIAPLVGAAALALLIVSGATGKTPARVADASARASGVQIVVAEGDETAVAAAQAPPNAGSPSSPYAYPEDGSIVSVQAVASMARTQGQLGVIAASEAVGLSLFRGEITAERVKGVVQVDGASGDFGDTTVAGLVVAGQPIAASENLRVPLGDWGYVLVLIKSSATKAASARSFEGSVTGLVVHLDADHGGLRAGSEIRVGFAQAAAHLAPQPKPASVGKAKVAKPARSGTETSPGATARPHDLALGLSGAKAQKETPSPLVLPPPTVTPKLTDQGYVFPVYGPSAYSDTFGAPRAGVSGGWHHGDDIFAPLGAPLLAVADGTVFSVGWNDIGGYRLWLRDSGGNEFYYAHLSAFSTLAVDGAHVKAGDVLGFVGNSGDAQGTPYHLHFEIHPVAMLFLGYDGAVNPTKYLDAWRRLDDIQIRPAVGWGAPIAAVSQAPPPGAILLQSTDISTASGLDPGSLARAMKVPVVGDLSGSGVAGLPVPLPVLDRS